MEVAAIKATSAFTRRRSRIATPRGAVVHSRPEVGPSWLRYLLLLLLVSSSWVIVRGQPTMFADEVVDLAGLND